MMVKSAEWVSVFSVCSWKLVETRKM